MIPESILSHSLKGDKVVPRFLGPEDTPWIEKLTEEFIRLDGHPRRVLMERLKEPFAFTAHPAKRELASATLMCVMNRSGPRNKPNQSRLVRAALFKAAHKCKNRDIAIEVAAGSCAVDRSEILSVLFADLKAERPIKTEGLSCLTPTDIALQANLLLARSLLSRSRRVKIEIFGECRPVIRQAKLRGLICQIESNDASNANRTNNSDETDNRVKYAVKNAGDGFCLLVSGPFAIFRHTLVYGRHLGELLPFLQSCNKFILEATCMIKGRERTMRLGSGDPLPPALNSKRFDSQLEQRFFRDFNKATHDWELVREPEPIVSSKGWIFPDFEVRHRHFSNRRWFIELVGFWSPEYLRAKFEKLKAASLSNFILCVDKKNACGRSENWPSTGAHVVEFSRRVDPHSVLAHIQSKTSGLGGAGASGINDPQ